MPKALLGYSGGCQEGAKKRKVGKKERMTREEKKEELGTKSLKW